MPRIRMIRHGKAAAGWDGHPDPGLDALGQRQAVAVAERLADGPPVLVLSSPLARTRESAAPLLERWGTEMIVEPRVAEIPSPTQDLAERSAWLRRAMAGRWSDLEETYRDWRDEVVACLASLDEDAVVFSHFIAINAAVGHCRRQDALVLFRPDHCSVTTFEVRDGRLRLDELGSEAETEVR